MTEQTMIEDKRIPGLQTELDRIAAKIDEHYDLAEFENATSEAELDSQFMLCLRVLHARYSAALHLLKKGIEPKPIKPIE
jgi:hypothetical protein